VIILTTILYKNYTVEGGPLATEEGEGKSTIKWYFFHTYTHFIHNTQSYYAKWRTILGAPSSPAGNE